MTIADDLIRDEGMKLKPYRDSVGKLTIGIGRNLDDVGISEAEAKVLLQGDLRRVGAYLDTALPWWGGLPEPASRGLMNMAFNLGVKKLLSFKRMLSALRSGDYATAAREALASRWAAEVGERAQRIADLFLEAQKGNT